MAAAAGATTITVDDITGFTDTQVIVIGTEIATISGAPAAGQITIGSPLAAAHSTNEPVYVVDSTTYSDTYGSYAFTNLDPGNYFVIENNPAFTNYVSTTTDVLPSADINPATRAYENFFTLKRSCADIVFGKQAILGIVLRHGKWILIYKFRHILLSLF